jgi:hypothetical protein
MDKKTNICEAIIVRINEKTNIQVCAIPQILFVSVNIRPLIVFFSSARIQLTPVNGKWSLPETIFLRLNSCYLPLGLMPVIFR